MLWILKDKGNWLVHDEECRVTVMCVKLLADSNSFSGFGRKSFA